jgi:hypothetical protein
MAPRAGLNAVMRRKISGSESPILKSSSLLSLLSPRIIWCELYFKHFVCLWTFRRINSITSSRADSHVRCFKKANVSETDSVCFIRLWYQNLNYLTQLSTREYFTEAINYLYSDKPTYYGRIFQNRMCLCCDPLSAISGQGIIIYKWQLTFSLRWWWGILKSGAM